MIPTAYFTAQEFQLPGASGVGPPQNWFIVTQKEWRGEGYEEGGDTLGY